MNVCPVKIPLTKLIVNQRQRRVAEGFSPAAMSIGMRLFEVAARSPSLFSSGERLAEIFWPIMRMLGGKDVTGRVPRPSPKSLRRRVK